MTTEAYLFSYALAGVVTLVFILAQRAIMVPRTDGRFGWLTILTGVLDFLIWPVVLVVVCISVVAIYRKGIDVTQMYKQDPRESPYETAMEKPRYWMCVIGPADQTEIPHGSDLPMRDAVRDGFGRLTGHRPCMISSGWGLTKERFEEISEVWNREGEPKR